MVTHCNMHLLVLPNDLTIKERIEDEIIIKEPIKDEIFELLIVKPFINR